MQSFRCAIVPLGGMRHTVGDVMAALAGCAEVEPVECSVGALDGEALSGTVFVAGADALETVWRHVRELRRQHPGMAILVTVAGAVADMLDAVLAAGADDFVSVPFEPAELVTRMRRALGTASGQARPAAAGDDRTQIRGLVYASAESARLAGRIRTVARCDANVLLMGETGTGKEVCAQAVHYLSRRAANPWVAVNCGAIPAELVENELFGHVRGAYTTAHNARAGLVREAEGGTLFLDDVDCLPLAAQAKLLRFLQEREYRPVGSNAVLRADVRVLAASNCNLHELAMRATFRQDLYYRLNVLRLNLLPLRERREDIAVLARHFVHQCAREFAHPAAVLAPSAMHKLHAHHWPGNVRELKHVIERAVLLCDGATVQAVDVEFDADGPAVHAGEEESFRSAKSRVVREFERGYLERLLVACCGNITQAARAAQKDRRAFFELLRKHAIEPQRFRADPH